MYCEKCGRELPAGSAYCPECGEESKGKAGRPAKKGIIAIGISVAVVVAATVLSINLFSVNSSPEKVTETMFRAMYEADAKTMTKCYADYWLQGLTRQFDLPDDASRKEITNALARDWRYEEPIKITVKSCEVVEMYDKDEYRIYPKEEGMSAEEYDSITKIAKVKIVFVTEENEKREATVTCYKMSGKWYVGD